jgi:hypothetical protein
MRLGKNVKNWRILVLRLFTSVNTTGQHHAFIAGIVFGVSGPNLFTSRPVLLE